MKQKDFAMIAIIVIVSVVISILVSNALFGGPKNRQLKAAKVDPISSEFSPLDNKYFNKNSIDPTQTIQIGNSKNPDPFKQPEQ